MTENDRKIARWSAGVVAGVGVVYVIVGSIGVALRPAGAPMLAQVDPWLAILEALIIVSALAMITLMAAIHTGASPQHKTHATAALSFTIAFALLTCATHFLSLTLGRQVADAALVRELRFEWPSAALAVDLLAWELFLGLALLFCAATFGDGPLGKTIRNTMIVGGALCVVGVIGPLSGQLAFDYPAIIGRAFVLPAICVLLVIRFGRQTTERS